MGQLPTTQIISCTRTIGASCRHFNSITYHFFPTVWQFPNDFALFVGSGWEYFLVQDECVDDDTVAQNIHLPGRKISPIIIDGSRVRNTMTVFHYSLAAGQQALYLTMKEQFHHIHIDPTEIMIRIVVGVEELPASYRDMVLPAAAAAAVLVIVRCC